ncbi:alpha-hydroxy-acid oxidizing protein [Jiella sp. M17.18]|uniref:alpha-hydroxy-acid oxidizing protein n=1 Tax=Jiella sp. M17.18 TaxID=3234247 RepID=UPI0034E02B23
MPSLGRHRQTKIYADGLLGRRPAVPTAPAALEAAAKKKLDASSAAYFLGGAGAERTMAENRAAFDRYPIVQRMLRNVSSRDLSIELFGRTLPLPFLLGPIGVLEMAHREADLAAARAASAAGIGFVTSNQASYPMEAVADAVGSGPRWFQLYWSARDELVESFLDRAERYGYEAIVVTLDTTELGWRCRDLDLGYLPFLRGRGIANYLSDPVFQRLSVADEEIGPLPRPRLGAVASLAEFLGSQRKWSRAAAPMGPKKLADSIRRFLAIYSRTDLSWDKLAALREKTRLPIVLKGILHPDDARRALDCGVDGLVVSNHGGRQVDGAAAALDQLPLVADAVESRVPVLFDSGIRTGADIVKALGLGATAVLIGRPYICGLALAGEAGVRAVIDNLAADLDLTLGLSGRRSVGELDRSIFAGSPSKAA